MTDIDPATATSRSLKQDMSPSGTRRSRSESLSAWVRALNGIKVCEDSSEVTLPSLLDNLAKFYGSTPALVGTGEALSYRALASHSNRFARWALSNGLIHGDVVCLLMPNRPHYVAIWLGLARAGCSVALINTNLTGNALLHSLQAAGSAYLIVDPSLLPAVTAIATQLHAATTVWVYGSEAAGFANIEADVAQQTGLPLSASEWRFPMPHDRALLIYTSGTTGYPKRRM